MKGCGLYSKTSLLNHTCDPNARIIAKYDDYRHDVVATRDIEIGEEIEISYLNRDGVKTVEDEQQYHQEIKQRYLFSYPCNLCTFTKVDS